MPEEEICSRRKRRGVEKRFAIDAPHPRATNPDPVLLKEVKRAHRCMFSNGRQVDLLMTDADSYNGPLKRFAGESRVTQWNRIFGSAATVEQIERAAVPGTAFADDAVAGSCGLIGLPGDRAQRHFSDFAEDRDAALTLYFRETAAPIPSTADT